jgi:hypothetical protein
VDMGFRTKVPGSASSSDRCGGAIEYPSTKWPRELVDRTESNSPRPDLDNEANCGGRDPSEYPATNWSRELLVRTESSSPARPDLVDESNGACRDPSSPYPATKWPRELLVRTESSSPARPDLDDESSCIRCLISLKVMVSVRRPWPWVPVFFIRPTGVLRLCFYNKQACAHLTAGPLYSAISLAPLASSLHAARSLRLYAVHAAERTGTAGALFESP